MGRFFEIFNFDNIGGKIKGFAKWSCWISIILTWVCAIISFLVLLFSSGAFLYAFLVPIIAILDSLLIWVGSWTMYALGEHDMAFVYWNLAKQKNNGDIPDLEQKVEAKRKAVNR